jgi:probable rRNA maturation factor
VIGREAREQRKPLIAHYAHLTIHAVLHLRGFDHARPADAVRMERAEIRILRQFGHANPYLIAPVPRPVQ